MTRALVAARVLVGEAIVEGRAVILAGERIADVVAADRLSEGAEVEALGDVLLAPGFIDTQVNGGGGVLFNDAPTPETIATIGAAHRRFGTTGFLPTLISDDYGVIRAGIAAVEQAIEWGVPGVLGIHIEGPFLNVERHGIHDPARIRPLDDEGLAILTSARRGQAMVTLAPERTDPARIAALVAAGVVVSAGHTNARYDEVRAALDAGMTGFTHLFNAMSPLGSREPGVVGAALDAAEAWCGLIVDGQHVHPATMRLAARALGSDRLMLVTDAMPSVGQADKSFALQGHKVTVRDGACFNEDGTLAGSDLDMALAVANAQAMIGLSLEQSLLMASRSPARFLRLDGETGAIAAGMRADLVALDRDGRVARTWIAGG